MSRAPDSQANVAIVLLPFGKERGKKSSERHPHHWQAGTDYCHVLFGYRPYRGGDIVYIEIL